MTLVSYWKVPMNTSVCVEENAENTIDTPSEAVLLIFCLRPFELYYPVDFAD
jgi:hypothetical protein